MVDSKKKKEVTIRFDETLHKPVRMKVAELDTSFQAVITDLLKRWVEGELEIGDPEEKRLIEEYRRATLPKRQKMLAVAAKTEGPLGPERMPSKIRGK